MNESHNPEMPLYLGTRKFLGSRDLVVSFYTMKCQFQCAYCALPTRSAAGRVTAEQVRAQIDHVFAAKGAELDDFQQFSAGNEGSVLDRARFPGDSLDYLLRRAKSMRNLEVLSLETRPEYVEREYLEHIARNVHAPLLDITVGFETQDDHIRQAVLRKKISRQIMEDRIALLGSMGMRLTSYVLIKPAPRMTDEQGIREAIATMEYLQDTCHRHGTDLVIYLTPTYVANGSHFQQIAKPGDWVPPTIQSVFRVLLAGHRMKLPVYTGLWSEELADDQNDFRGRVGYDPFLRKAMAVFNRTRDFTVLEPFTEIYGEAGC